MNTLEYSKRLGKISSEQFQAALDRFDLGSFVQAESIPFGLFGQNVFLRSTEGDYVLRGDPHFPWQFPTDCFFARLLHERTQVPVPWPYMIEPSEDVFGWSYAIMPRLPGLQLADPKIKDSLGEDDKRGIARAMGKNLASMQQFTVPFSGRYNSKSGMVHPFELAQELSWPFPVQNDVKAYTHPFSAISYNDRTTASDVIWVEELITHAQSAFEDAFQSCFVTQDYQEHNVVVERTNGLWRVSGLFDLMESHFGDGEADLSRTIAMYLDENPILAQEFAQAFVENCSLRPGFAERFPIYMLHDRLIIWEYFQRSGNVPWNEKKSFRDWTSLYTSYLPVLHL